MVLRFLQNMTSHVCVDTIQSAMEQNDVSTSNERRLRRERKLNAMEWNGFFDAYCIYLSCTDENAKKHTYSK